MSQRRFKNGLPLKRGKKNAGCYYGGGNLKDFLFFFFHFSLKDIILKEHKLIQKIKYKH